MKRLRDIGLTVIGLLVIWAAWALWNKAARPMQRSTTPYFGSGAPSSCTDTQMLYIDTTTGNLWDASGGSCHLLATSAPLTGTTGSIGGSLLALGGNSSGTASVTGATTSMACIAQPSDGTNMAALGLSVECNVTANGTVTVNIVAFLAITPAAKTYNVRVFP